jgi:DNA uptake protein ComE-like DNA-binding protein
MNFRSWAQRPTLFLAGVLLAATVSACSSAATASIAPAAVPTQATAPQSTVAAPTTAPAADTSATVAPAVDSPATAAPTEAAPTAAATTAAEQATTAVAKINLNTATAEQILTVPNAGNRMVREFQEYRPYTSITQFRKEIGKYVDAATVAGYEQYVYVPVDPNQSDEATLQQIPGVTADLAKALVAARPYASNEAFLQKLAASLSSDQVAAAKAYLQ